MTKLMDLANRFENKLNKTSSEKEELPKAVQKIAKAEQKLFNKVNSFRSKFDKTVGEITVKTASGLIPCCYQVCSECSGKGKIAFNEHSNIKFASTVEYVNHLLTKECNLCNGKRVVKVADVSKCSEEQIEAFEKNKEEVGEKKMSKKATKAAKKAEKAAKKAEKAKLAVEDPEAYKELKTKAKAEKKALKAAKKAEKAKAKADKHSASY